MSTDQVRELAAHDDWRARVGRLELSERDAYELRVAVLRERAFHATARGAANARRRRRA